MTASLLPLLSFRCGFTTRVKSAWSPANLSSARMDNPSSYLLRLQFSSHGWLQTRPVVPGIGFLDLRYSNASSIRFSWIRALAFWIGFPAGQLASQGEVLGWSSSPSGKIIFSIISLLNLGGMVTSSVIGCRQNIRLG